MSTFYFIHTIKSLKICSKVRKLLLLPKSFETKYNYENKEVPYLVKIAKYLTTHKAQSTCYIKVGCLFMCVQVFGDT